MTVATASITERRLESKLILPATRGHFIDAWLRVHEAHFAPIYQPRWINNIYFDTEECASLREAIEGDCRRMKVRLRWYGEQPRFTRGTLEFKCKAGSVGWKRSCAIESPFDLETQSWREILRAIRAGTPVEQRVIFEQACRPALLNRYLREYHLSFDRSVRITVDRHLRSWTQLTGLRPNLRRSRRCEFIVLEFKAPRERAGTLSAAIQALGCRIDKHSKYVTGMAGA